MKGQHRTGGTAPQSPQKPVIASRGNENVSLDQANFTGADHRFLPGFGAEREVDRP